jgi:hypothetical protein
VGNTETSEEEVTIETVGAQIETDREAVISYFISLTWPNDQGLTTLSCIRNARPIPVIRILPLGVLYAGMILRGPEEAARRGQEEGQ